MDVAAIMLATVAAIIGGGVQSILGFGAAFTLVPALALVAPDLLPGSAITAFLPLSAVMAVRERASLDRRAATRLLLGRIPGTILGTMAVVALPVRGLAAVVAVLLLIAVAATARGWTIAETPRNEAGAGVVSGFAGTAVGLGGPPLALLYRGRHSSELRPTLAVVFTVGIVLSIATLAYAGEFTSNQATAGLGLAAANVIGLVVAAPLLKRLPEPVIRNGLLVWAGLGSILALVRVVIG